ANAVPARSGRSYAEQREHDKLVRRARKKVEDAEAEVSRLEAEVAAVEAEMAAGEYTPEIAARHADSQKKLDNAMSLWELAQLDLDSLQ
ncbi:MAG: hypothetical protein K2M57_00210, partial [Paramuribaculum sp.]|nr:hypothetical protein [Paramuribaculum sp.]